MNPAAASESEERRRVFAQERASSLRNDSFHLIVLPTEHCNFRCTYCYEDFSIGRMSPPVVQGVKRLLDRRLDDLRTLHLSWFGGEPLLAADIVEDISSHVVAGQAGRPGLRYTGGMTTNGYLLDAAMVSRLARLGIREFQVSLDGPEEMHDRTRVRADGRGSYARLWRNLLAVRDGDAPVAVVLRVHLTPGNLAAMPDFLALLRDTFLADRRFSVLLKPVERLGGPHDATMDIIDKGSQSQILARLEAILRTEEDGPRPAGRVSGVPVCYAARANSLVVRADGRLAKCTVSLTDPANDLGRLRPDGTLAFRNDRLHPWLRGWQSADWDVLHCPADGLTLGAPPLLQIGPAPRGRT
ncbi:radical SAM protein [Streptomyces sp. NPDC049555]|uniref:radical SAM protein n=1 Tax=Streptomyces sp. NPDC049555 TaxID=3154930 RepID=UPI00341C0917